MIRKKQNVEYSVWGEEPEYNGNLTQTELLFALNWYNYFHEPKDCIKWVTEYMKAHNYTDEQIEQYSKKGLDFTTQHMCSIARIINRGGIVDYDLDSKIKEILEKNIEYKEEAKIKRHTENVLIEILEELMDNFYKSDLSKTFDPTEPISQSSVKFYKPALNYYSSIFDELEEMKKDDQLKEGYSHLSKEQIINYKKQLKLICDKLNTDIINNKRTIVRKPRKKKKKSPEKLVKAFRYLDFDKGLGIKSIAPSHIIDANIVWVFNTKDRKLIKYVAEKGKKLTVKGTTILNFDEKTSEMKNIRSPEIVKGYLSDPKTVLDANFKEIRSKGMEPNGRTNAFTLIIRIFK